jgi:hypothetical protein
MPPYRDLDGLGNLLIMEFEPGEFYIIITNLTNKTRSSIVCLCNANDVYYLLLVGNLFID